MADPDHVLVVALGDPDDEDALAHALETFPEAAVTLLSVVAPLDQSVSEGRILERSETRLTEARDRADGLRTSAADPSRVTVETREGSPADLVPTYADRHGVDHVVVSGHDVSGIVRRLLGDGIPELIAERTGVPVTILQ
ncbi:universal stress family protein [Halovivax ruber XH-70]|uniref:Universal stress family protein n=1 Tax=Halovivax ruber (strain DSM 18193 / JCM 13892 / XH-70) TaxID=797302 RepID=L0IFX5_HALRX|nr:universal stress protein [Halovivax ruber]AGB17743.1 universal stress family protein [Halovivax ruber XH-70]